MAVVPEADTESPPSKTKVEVDATTQATAQAMSQAKSAFKILELELAFVRDYFYTLYPVVFWKGLSSLCFSLLLSMATFALALWLAVGISKANKYSDHHQSSDGYLAVWVGGCNVDVVLTWVFLSFMMFKEVWEILTYLLSNWTRLLLVCKYVQSGLWFMKFTVTENVISSFFVSNIADPWHGRIDQYDFLPSTSYNPSFWKLVNRVTLGKTPEKYDGRKSGEAIKVPDCVKPAIIQALCRIGLDKLQLPREIPSLVKVQFEQYRWALLDLGTCSEVILVWHIATSLCEIKLAQECKMDLTKPGFLRSAWSGLKTFASCTSKPYLVNKSMTGQLETDYHIAISLSRYCAYLLVFRSELLPDSFIIPDLIFDETLQKAGKRPDDCNLVWCWYNKLMVIAEEAAPKGQEVIENNQGPSENYVDKRLSMNTLQQGATLGKDLISMDREKRWNILAGVWADLLVHIAPSWNAVDHKKNLESGGEFITIIWALLSHCGIEKSTLWDKNEASVGNVQTPLKSSPGTNHNEHIRNGITGPVDVRGVGGNQRAPGGFMSDARISYMRNKPTDSPVPKNLSLYAGKKKAPEPTAEGDTDEEFPGTTMRRQGLMSSMTNSSGQDVGSSSASAQNAAPAAPATDYYNEKSRMCDKEDNIGTSSGQPVQECSNGNSLREGECVVMYFFYLFVFTMYMQYANTTVVPNKKWQIRWKWKDYSRKR